jgi:hypothetical protein
MDGRLTFCLESILETKPHILIFGDSAMLGALAATLRASSRLDVRQHRASDELAGLQPDIILVDAEETTAEQFCVLIPICPAILSVDPLTYQLTVLSFPRQFPPLAEVARAVEILSFVLRQPA